MKKLRILPVSIISLLAVVSNAVSTEPNVLLSISPAVNYLGDPVIYTAELSGYDGDSKITWTVNGIDNNSGLITIATGNPFTNTYKSTGEKAVTAHVDFLSNGVTTKSLERTIASFIQNSRNTAITVSEPNTNTIWRVGSMCKINWTSTGSAKFVQINLIDTQSPKTSAMSYPTNVSISYSTPNTGSYEFALTTNILGSLSGGFVQGKHYQVKVYPLDGGLVGESPKNFTVYGPFATGIIAVTASGTNQSIAVNAPNQYMGAFTAVIQNEPIIFSGISFESSSTNKMTGITLVKEDNTIIAGPVETAVVGTRNLISFTNIAEFPTGTNMIRIQGKIPLPATNNQTFFLKTIPATNWVGGSGAYTGKSIIAITNIVQNGPLVTVKLPDLSASMDSAWPCTISPGTDKVLGKIVLDTTKSIEGIRMYMLNVNFDAYDGLAHSDISNIRLFDDAVPLNNKGLTIEAYEPSIYLVLDLSLLIPKNSVKTLTVKGDVSYSAINNSSFDFSLSPSNFAEIIGEESKYEFTGSVDTTKSTSRIMVKNIPIIPIITNISPPSVMFGSNSVITITGTNFTGNNTVIITDGFNQPYAITATTNRYNTIIIDMPLLSVRDYRVSVSNANGTSENVAFIITPSAPVIDSGQYTISDSGMFVLTAARYWQGATYQAETSQNLVDWTPVGQEIKDTLSSPKIAVPFSSNEAVRFYRIRVVE